MQDAIGKAAQAAQRRPVVEVAGYRNGPGGTPASALVAAPQQGIDPVPARQNRQGAPRDVTATDNQ